MRSPRRFHHEYIYANDRKQRLEEIEQRAKTSLEQATEHSQVEELPWDADRLRGAFTAHNSHLQRRGAAYGVALGSRVFLFVALLLFMGYVLLKLFGA